MHSQPGLLCDGSRRGRVVPGDHDHTNTGGTAFGHRGGHFCAHRVGQAEQTHELKIEAVLFCRPVLPGKRPARHRQYAQSLGRQPFDRACDP